MTFMVTFAFHCIYPQQTQTYVAKEKQLPYAYYSLKREKIATDH